MLVDQLGIDLGVGFAAVADEDESQAGVCLEDGPDQPQLVANSVSDLIEYL